MVRDNLQTVSPEYYLLWQALRWPGFFHSLGQPFSFVTVRYFSPLRQAPSINFLTNQVCEDSLCVILFPLPATQRLFERALRPFDESRKGAANARSK